MAEGAVGEASGAVGEASGAVGEAAMGRGRIGVGRMGVSIPCAATPGMAGGGMTRGIPALAGERRSGGSAGKFGARIAIAASACAIASRCLCARSLRISQNGRDFAARRLPREGGVRFGSSAAALASPSPSGSLAARASPSLSGSLVTCAAERGVVWFSCCGVV